MALTALGVTCVYRGEHADRRVTGGSCSTTRASRPRCWSTRTPRSRCSPASSPTSRPRGSTPSRPWPPPGTRDRSGPSPPTRWARSGCLRTPRPRPGSSSSPCPGRGRPYRTGRRGRAHRARLRPGPARPPRRGAAGVPRPAAPASPPGRMAAAVDQPAHPRRTAGGTRPPQDAALLLASASVDPSAPPVTGDDVSRYRELQRRITGQIGQARTSGWRIRRRCSREPGPEPGARRDSTPVTARRPRREPGAPADPADPVRRSAPAHRPAGIPRDRLPLPAPGARLSPPAECVRKEAIAAAVASGYSMGSMWSPPSMPASWRHGNQSCRSFRASVNTGSVLVPRTDRMGQRTAATSPAVSPSFQSTPARSNSKAQAASGLTARTRRGRRAPAGPASLAGRSSRRSRAPPPARPRRRRSSAPPGGRRPATARPGDGGMWWAAREGEGHDAAGVPGRERQGDQRPHQVAGDVGGADAVMVQQAQGIAGVLGERRGPRRLGARALAVSPPVVEDPAERGQRRRLVERHHGVGDQEPVDQQQRVTVTSYPVGQRDVADPGALQGRE